MGDTHNAIKQYKETLKYNPSHIEGILQLAAVYEETEQYLDALQQYKNAIRQGESSSKLAASIDRCKEELDKRNIEY